MSPSRTVVVVALAALMAAGASAPAAAITVTRGPYLQQGSPTSLVVRWRTDVATNSRVEFGPAPDTLSSHADSSRATTEHVVVLTALAPDTRRYYAVGSTTARLAGGDSTYFFVTAPVDGAAKSTRIWLLGDSGTASSLAAAVRDRYYAYTGPRHTDLWIMLGDNAYASGTDSEYQAAVFDFYPTMLRKSVLWPLYGNHDAYSSSTATESGPYYDDFTLPKNGEAGGLPSGTEAYYSFNYGNIHFVCLGSSDSLQFAPSAMLTWLSADLAADHHEWCIALWHHPPYTKGSHDSDVPADSDGRLVAMRENVLPMLEGHGVDVVFGGHSHSYERSYLLDEHYGYSWTLVDSMILDHGDGRVDGTGAYHKNSRVPAPHQGAVYVVEGSSGQTGGGPLNHPAMYRSLNLAGSLILDVNGDRLDLAFLDNGGNIQDHFTMTKSATGGVPPIARPTGLALSRATPTPFSGRATLRMASDRNQQVVLRIYDVSGRRIAEAFRGALRAGRTVEVTLDGSSWPSGLYFARLEGESGEVQQPVVLTR